MTPSPIPVYLVQFGHSCLPLSLGMLHAHVRAQADLRDRFSFHFLLSPSPETVAKAPPGVWLFPNYMWSFEFNMEVSRLARRTHAGSVTIHGGPSAPKYPGACAEFLRAQDHVDVAVRGEGEAAVADLLRHVAAAVDGRRELRDGLSELPGISFLAEPGGALVQTPERPRIDRLDTIASPYLDGTFDAWVQPRARLTTVETNRGCPYGCTFCDWGSATQQKIHVFDVERVKAEIDWIGAHRIPVLFFGDANFGIFDRDVEIAEHIGRTKQRHGFPQEVVVSYAKNGNDRIPEIVRAMVSAGVVTEGVISIQTSSPEALRAVRRENIKTANYEKLVSVYRQEGLPVSTDLLIGLPGSTLASHKEDMQWCLDEDIVARWFPTFILPNSPMADPAYVAEHQIRVRGGQIVGTATASEDDLGKVADLVRVYALAEKSSLLRYVTRWLQWEHGLPASEFLFGLGEAVARAPEAFPEYVNGFDRTTLLNGVMNDPEPFYEAVWRHCAVDLGLPLGSDADRVVFQLNAAVVPRRGVRYPIEVASPFDVLGYFGSCLAPAPGEHRALRRLEEPQRFEISDPDGYATKDFQTVLIVNNALRFFELDWPVRRGGISAVLYDDPLHVRPPRIARREPASGSGARTGVAPT